MEPQDQARISSTESSSKRVVILPGNPNPCLGDVCIPISRIRAAMKIFAPESPHFESNEDCVIDYEVLLGVWSIVHDAVEEIRFIVDHNERQEYAEARVRREAEADLQEKITRVRKGAVPYDSLMNLQAIKQMLFCIAQDDSAAQELNAYSLLGISNILEDAGYRIERDYNEMISKEDQYIKRHMKLRADLAAFLEGQRFLCKSELAKILAEDEKRGADAI